MTLASICQLLEASVFAGEDKLAQKISEVFSCDLMSDVLALAHAQTLLMTGLNNPHVIRTAEMTDIPAILLVRNKRPTPEMVQMAREKGIVLLCTPLTLYCASGVLYQQGLPGCRINDKGECAPDGTAGKL